MFKVGDKIVYPMYGAGTITDIVESNVLGELRSYYRVSLPYFKLEASVPVDNAETVGLRGIIDKSEISEVFEVLSGDSDEMTPNWNRRFRENTDKLKTGDIKIVASVVRNLVRADRAKPLSTGEKKLLSTAKQILVSELECAGSYTAEEADALVESHI
jgi:CarD family transcriptional regulator